jgi:hypothetical protein
MAAVEKIVEQMRREPAGLRFGDLLKVLREVFWKASGDWQQSCDLQDALAG